MLSYSDFERTGGQLGTNAGGVYRGPDGQKWYLKWPTSDRQGHNEIMASRFYDEMGFDAVQYHPVDNGMVASRWREGLPDVSSCEDLRGSETMQEAFAPSALIGNWDVVGLVYDNALYDPATMGEPVFVDFGGSFDTRAMGGHKRFGANSIPALDGFTDPSINKSAACVFEAMTPELWDRSLGRVRRLTPSQIEEVVWDVSLAGREARHERLLSRREILLDTDHREVS
ncbi:MAG: hypothetical protein ACOCR6_03600 [archaeon]